MMIQDIKDGRTFPDIGNVRLQMRWSPPSTSFSQGLKYSTDPVKKSSLFASHENWHHFLFGTYGMEEKNVQLHYW